MLIYFNCRCHGETDNVVFELANGKDLIKSNTFPYENFPLYLSNGVQVPRSTSDKLVTLAYEIIAEADNAIHPPDTSLGNFVMQRYVFVQFV